MDEEIITIPQDIVKRAGGVVVFPLAKFEALQQEIAGFRAKIGFFKNLKNFEELSAWGRQFAKKKKITQKQILAND